MNFYFNLITGAINFVEANIQEELSLEDVSREFNFSAFHFNRIFKTISGMTLKQYILGRKLSRAMERLTANADPIFTIAYDYGFKSPEVFSRDFKKQFGISPKEFRQNRPRLDPVQKINIVERDIINFQGQMALKGCGVYLNAFELEGMQLEVNIYQAGFENILRSASDAYYQEAQKMERFITDQLYALVNCLGEDNDHGKYNVFYGMEAISRLKNSPFTIRQVPGGWYEKFLYKGDIFDVRASFVNDLYRWVMVKEVELETNGIGMLDIFKADYPETLEVEILVPVKTPR